MFKVILTVLRYYFFDRFREAYSAAPNRWTLQGLLKSVNPPEGEPRTSTQDSHGRWVPARPLGMDTVENRTTLALAVLKGEADAVFWPS